MRTHQLTRLVMLTIAAAAIIAACSSSADEVSTVPFGIQDVVWQDLPVYVPADGQAQVELIVTLLTTGGKRVRNAKVDFNTTNGTLLYDIVVTDAGGQALNYLTVDLITNGVDRTALVTSVVDTTGAVVMPKSGQSVQTSRPPDDTIAIVGECPPPFDHDPEGQAERREETAWTIRDAGGPPGGIGSERRGGRCDSADGDHGGDRAGLCFRRQ
jgi:hypothetical protein